MMKFTAILLSNLILFQSLNIDLEFFPKIKVLLEHAQYHQDKYGDTFLEFLSEKSLAENCTIKKESNILLHLPSLIYSGIYYIYYD